MRARLDVLRFTGGGNGSVAPIYPVGREKVNCRAAAREAGLGHDLGAPCMPNHNGIFAAMRRRHTRGETRSFSPLANHPVFFGREQTYRSLPEDLRHLLPQIRARCARKVRNGKVSAAQLLKSNKKGRFHPSGALLFPSRRGAHRAPVPLGVESVLLTLPEQPGGSRKAALILARAARPVGEGGDSQEAGGT